MSDTMTATQSPTMTDDDVRSEMAKYSWYHTVELRPGIVTPGQYDHRPLMEHYALPDDLSGKTVLDTGPASGYFAFECEKRGAAKVVTLELPRWSAHDGSHKLKEAFAADGVDTNNEDYLHGALDFAVRARGSKVEQRFGNVYDVSPETFGMFDIVFCGSLLIHLTDPLRALYAIRSVTKDHALINTVLTPEFRPRKSRAVFMGMAEGQSFWAPNRPCLVQWASAAGFDRVEWISEFRLQSTDGVFDTPHGTVRASV